MSNPAIEFAKKYPFIIGGVIIGIVVLVALIGGGGGAADDSTAVAGSSDGQIAAGLQLQQIQAQSQTASAQIAAEREISLAGIAAALTGKQIDAEVSYNTNVLAAGIAEKTLASQQVQSSMQLNAELEKVKAEKETQLATVGALSNQATAATNASVRMAEIAAQPKGLLSWIFG